MARFLDQEAVQTGLMSEHEGFLESDDDFSSEPELVEETARDSSAARESARGSKRKLVYSEDSESDSMRSPLTDANQQRRKSRSQLTKNSHTSSVSRSLVQSDRVLRELQRSNKLLMTLVERVEKTEKRLKVVENKLESSFSSSVESTPSCKARARKKYVPIEVRRETRRVYGLLMDEDIENFHGWKIEPGVTYRDSSNQAVLSRVVREVKALNPVFLTQHIKDSAYRFYRSRCEEESVKRRGMLKGKNKSKRKHERTVRKYNERRAMAAKGKYRNEEERDKWMSVIKPEVMSSAESGEDDGEEVIIVRPLPWLSAEVTAFKQQLDEEIKKEKSPQARRQMKRRVIGSPSARPTPADEDFPAWALFK